MRHVRSQLADLGKGCQTVLQDLYNLLANYEGMGMKSQHTLDRLDWELKDVSDWSARLVSSTKLLAAFNTTLAK